MKRSGVTLVELICVAGILLALGSIAVPVVRSCIAAAHKASCANNLRQLYLAIASYRVDYDGDARFGDMYLMGLPLCGSKASLPLLYDLHCGEAGNDFFPRDGVNYYTYWLEPDERLDPTWAQYAQRFQGESILISDMNHNEKWKSLLYGDEITRFGLGVRESGALSSRRRNGDWMKRTWWN